jgi:hypothetical protein
MLKLTGQGVGLRLAKSEYPLQVWGKMRPIRAWLQLLFLVILAAPVVCVRAENAVRWYSGGTNAVWQYGEAGGPGTVFGAALPEGSLGLACGPDGYLYAGSYYSNRVLRINGTTGTPDPSWTVAVTSPNGLRFGPGNYLYVAGQAGTLDQIDTVAKTRTNVVAGVGTAYDVAFDLAGASAYLVSYNAGISHVYRYDTTTWVRDAGFDVIIPNGGLAYGVALGPDGKVYISYYYGKIYRYSTSGVQDSWSVTSPGYLTKGLTFGLDGLLYVAADTAGVARTDPASGSPALAIFATARDRPTFLTYAVTQVTNLVLALNGQPAATIVKGANVPDPENYAAQELQKYLQKISGALLPIKTTTDAVQGVQILLGTLASNNLINNFQERLGTIASLGTDAFTVKTIGNYLVLAGGGTPGALYATYDFLEKMLGCRWFTPTDLGEAIPLSATISVGPIDYTSAPSLQYRGMILSGGTHQYDQRVIDWMVRNKMNNKKTMLNVLPTDIPKLRARAMQPENVAHNFAVLVPADTYWATHPEYYPLIGGVRVRPAEYWSTDVQLCLSNPDVATICANGIKQLVAAYPDIKVFGVAQNDSRGGGIGWCDSTCLPCQALGPTITDRLVAFVNRIATNLHLTYPNVIIGTYAYADGNPPPVSAVPLPYVKFDYVRNDRCYKHTLNDPNCPDNTVRFNEISGWLSTTSPSRVAWEDYTDPWDDMPQPTAGVLAGDLKWLHSQGMSGFADVGIDSASPSWEMLKLNYYVEAKVAWDVTLTYDNILDDFCSRYYGPAAGALKQYYQTLDSAVSNSWGAFRRGSIAHVDAVLTPAILRSLKTNLNTALAQVTPGTDYYTRTAGEKTRYDTYVRDLYGKSNIDAPDSPNLVVNPGFENGTTGWELGYQSGQYVLSIDTTDAHSGSKSAKGVCTGTPGRALWNQTVTVQPGLAYYFSCWMKPSGTKPPGTTAIYVSNGTNLSDGALVYVSGNADETNVWQKVIVPHIAALDNTLGIYLLNDDVGNISFDDVILRTVQYSWPTITQQPAETNVCSGTAVTFQITATGDAPLSYRWQKNGIVLTNGGHYSGATNAILVISTPDTSDVANYRCIVTNVSGSATSSTAGLQLAGPPVQSGQPLIWDVIDEQYGSGSGRVSFNANFNYAFGSAAPPESLSSSMATLSLPRGSARHYPVKLPTSAPGWAGCGPTADATLEFRLALHQGASGYLYVSQSQTSASSTWDHILCFDRMYGNVYKLNELEDYNTRNNANIAPAGFDSALPHTYRIVHQAGVSSLYLDGALLCSLIDGAGASADGYRLEWGFVENTNAASTVDIYYFKAANGAFPPPATLNYSRSGSQLMLSWGVPGYSLYENTNVANSNGWTATAGGTASPVAVTIGAGTKYFRLKK